MDDKTPEEPGGPAVLAENIKAIVLRHIAGQDILPSELRNEGTFLDTISCDILSLNSNVNSDSTRFGLVSRARHQAKHIKSLYDVQRAITAKLEDELRSAQERVEVMGTVCGLASLPPELLAHAFSFAILGDLEPDKPRSFATLRLSHICRRFRNAVLSTPNLWSEVRAKAFNPEMEFVRTCVDRSQNAPLDVFLNLYTNHIKKGEMSACDPVLFAVLPHANRWRTLHLTFNYSQNFLGLPGRVGALEVLQNLAAPNLETVTEIHGTGDRSNFGRGMHFLSSWKMPKLNRLSLTDCLPISIEDLTTITRLDVHLINRTFNRTLSLANLVRVLSRATSLCHLQVNLDRFETMDSLKGFGQVVSLENVRQLKFNFCLGDIAYEDDTRTIVLQSFFSALRFPNSVDLHIQCVKSAYSALIGGRAVDLCSFLQNLFDDHRFPRLINCHIDIHVPYDQTRHRNVSCVVTLPTDFPPELENLTIACNTSLALESFRVVPERLLKLRSLTVDITRHCSNDTVALARWAGWMARCLQSYGSWDTFQELHLLARDCVGDRDEPGSRIDTVILRDHLVAWCESNMEPVANNILCNTR